MLKRILRSRRGEGYIDVCVLVLCAMLVIALAVQVLPAFIAKQQLDTFATELVREAEIAGRIGPETDRREQALREQTGLDPEIEWSDTGRIQLNEEVRSRSLMRSTSVSLPALAVSPSPCGQMPQESRRCTGNEQTQADFERPARRGLPPDYCHCAGAGNADVLHQRIFPSAHRGPGGRDAVQEAVISTVNDNYDDVYHGVREGYSGAYQPLAGDFEESLDYGDIYGRLDDILGLTYRGGYHTQYTEDGGMEFRVWGLDVEIRNAPFASGDSAGDRFVADCEIELEVQCLLEESFCRPCG